MITFHAINEMKIVYLRCRPSGIMDDHYYVWVCQ